MDWLEVARNRAEERFRSLPLPSAKDENYRFTTLALPPDAALPMGSAADLPSEAATLDEDEISLLSLVGEEATAYGNVNSAMFTDLQRAVVLGIDSVRSHLKNDTIFPQDKFAQLTAARWQNGVYLHVPAGVKVPGNLRACVVSQGAESHNRNLITLEEGSEAVFVQELRSDENAGFVSELTEVKLGRGAKLHWVILQNFESATKAVIRQRIELEKGAELKVTPLHLGGASVQLRQENILREDSSLELAGAARGERSQQFDFWLDVDHSGSRSKSEMNFSFVMGGSAKAVFNGLIHIRKTAADCNASQKSKSLLLGGKATVHAIPKLIIQTDAVKCSHGASVSNVNPEQVHYLQSRGISRVEAERMIVRGFTEPVLDRLPTDALQGRADAALDKKGWLQ